MGANTPKLALYKADPTEFALVDVDINAAFDKIDANLPTVVCTSSTRPATPFTGMLIYETNTTAIRIWTGTTWKAQGTIVCTSATRPSNPSIGDQIYETDTDRTLIRTADNKWTVYLTTWRTNLTLNVDTNVAQQGATPVQGRVLTFNKDYDGVTPYRFSAGWPAVRTAAGTAGPGDALFFEIARSQNPAGANFLTLQRSYTGDASSSGSNQNGGTLSVEHTPPAGNWDIFLRVVEYDGSIGTFVIWNSGNGLTFLNAQELTGAKY